MSAGIYSKHVTRRLWDELLASRRKLTTWCRSNRINRGEMVASVKKHFPQEWADKEHLLGPIPTAFCGYDGLEFVINNAKQAYCDGGCARKAWALRNPEAEAAMRLKTKENEKAKLASRDGKENPAG